MWVGFDGKLWKNSAEPLELDILFRVEYCTPHFVMNFVFAITINNPTTENGFPTDDVNRYYRNAFDVIHMRMSDDNVRADILLSETTELQAIDFGFDCCATDARPF